MTHDQSVALSVLETVDATGVTDSGSTDSTFGDAGSFPRPLGAPSSLGGEALGATSASGSGAAAAMQALPPEGLPAAVRWLLAVTVPAGHVLPEPPAFGPGSTPG